VPEEFQPQALALAGAGDQAGHVGDGVHLGPCGDDAEVGLQGGERVVGDFRAGGREYRDERGLPRAREADQADIGHRLELEHDVGALTRFAEQREAGCFAGTGGQRAVAQPAASAAGSHVACAGTDEVCQHHAVLGQHHGAGRNAQLEALAVGAVAVVTLAGAAVAGLGVRAEVKIEQGVNVVVDHQGDVATVTTVATVRATQRLVLLSVDRGAPVPAVAGLQVQDGAVDEPGHGHLLGVTAGPTGGCGGSDVAPPVSVLEPDASAADR